MRSRCLAKQWKTRQTLFDTERERVTERPMTASITVLGQCHFTYRYVRELIALGQQPRYVCIPKSGADSDPFLGLERPTNGETDWLHAHLWYHRLWRTGLAQLCAKSDITLVETGDPLEDLPQTDLLIVAAYAHKVPASALTKYAAGAINVHPSLLPTYRGPQPEAQMILHEEIMGGVTLHVMTPKFDSGPIVAQKSYMIPCDADVADMERIEAKIAAELSVDLEPEKVGRARAQTGTGTYYRAYDIEQLDLSHVPSVTAAKTLLRLRPEGYAYAKLGESTLYPIEIGSENRPHALRMQLEGTAECYCYRWVRTECGRLTEVYLGRTLANT
jgi:hypothetical protein